MCKASKPLPSFSEKDKSRFLKKQNPTPTPAGCIEWVGTQQKRGYGKFGVSGRQLIPSRVAYFLATGIDPFPLLVLHSCDNPICVNPEHLSTGTTQDNSNDRQIRGRSSVKLSPPIVIEMREIHEDGLNYTEIAKLFNISPSTARYACKKLSWKHIA